MIYEINFIFVFFLIMLKLIFSFLFTVVFSESGIFSDKKAPSIFVLVNRQHFHFLLEATFKMKVRGARTIYQLITAAVGFTCIYLTC